MKCWVSLKVSRPPQRCVGALEVTRSNKSIMWSCFTAGGEEHKIRHVKGTSHVHVCMYVCVSAPQLSRCFPYLTCPVGHSGIPGLMQNIPSCTPYRLWSNCAAQQFSLLKFSPCATWHSCSASIRVGGACLQDSCSWLRYLASVSSAWLSLGCFSFCSWSWSLL